MQHFHQSFESNYKKFGLLIINKEHAAMVNAEKYKPYIKVLYLPADYTITVDFKQYITNEPTLFFINSNQYTHLEKEGNEDGYFIYYNRDFYCVQIHDAEVACDGLLFNNIYDIPATTLTNDDHRIVASIFEQLLYELTNNDTSQEEMLRTYLKQLIIRATRIWKKQQLSKETIAVNQDVDFFRTFSRLVEIHYKEKHAVSEYAELMNIAPKTLTHKLNKLHVAQPNEVIKDRIILEAKRLLIYTSMTAKEIAYALGYDDPAYFNRLFAQKVGGTTSSFRKKYNEGKMYN